MTLNVTQTINIRILRVNTIANSSVLQIGSAGLVKALSNNFNTGGFTGPAPQATAPGSGENTEEVTGRPPSLPTVPLVPLPALQ